MNRLSVLVAIVTACPCFALTARDYYNELWTAGGLDQILSHYVCFDERPELETFFLFTESKIIREVMTDDGAFSKLPKDTQAQLKKDLLIFRGYDKGVPISVEDDYSPDSNGSWVSEKFTLDKKTPAQMRFGINWNTLRYKRSLEMLNANGTMQSVISTYGRCELVSHTVKQHGK
jgi:hypothetical protein